MINKRIRTEIYKFINDNFNETNGMEFAEYVSLISKDILQNIDQLNENELIEAFGDNSSSNKNFRSYVQEMQEWLSTDQILERICIENRSPYFYVKNKYSDELFPPYLEKLNRLKIFDEKKRGDIFEAFCCKAYEDFGFYVELTKSSGDAGVDVISYCMLHSSNDYLNKFHNLEIKLFIQVKYYDKPADIAALRHFWGDYYFWALPKTPIFSLVRSNSV